MMMTMRAWRRVVGVPTAARVAHPHYRHHTTARRGVVVMVLVVVVEITLKTIVASRLTPPTRPSCNTLARGTPHTDPPCNIT
jgi:hypothetical protein